MDDSSLAPSAAPALPDKPCLRPIEAYPVDNPQRDPMAPKLLQLRDPSGLAPGTVTLPPLGAAVLQFCDGTNSRAEILIEFQRRYGRDLSAATLDGMIARLDEALMLDSQRFKAHAQQIFSAFAAADVREPIQAGHAYPSDPDALVAQLAGFFEKPNGPGLPDEGAHRADDAPPPPRALIAPHSEFARGGPAYAWAYRPLLRARRLPPLIVLLGTDHGSLDPSFTLTRKHFQTPLGRLDCDVELVDQLLEDARAVSKVLPDLLLKEEHRHRGEHSLEMQATWLRFVLGRRKDEAPVKILPILCGSLADYVDGKAGLDEADPAASELPRSMYGPFLRVLRDRIAARAAEAEVLWIVSAELAHVGPRFGDKDPLSGQDHESLERRDHETLRILCSGDGDGWLKEIRRERDGRRVTGLSPIYALLKAASPALSEGQVRCYAQCQAEAGSVVSIASVLFS